MHANVAKQHTRRVDGAKDRDYPLRCGRPGHLPLMDELSGRVPAGAARAVVIDDRGEEHLATIADGVWTACVEASELLVRFIDDDGAIVAEPLPEGERR